MNNTPNLSGFQEANTMQFKNSILNAKKEQFRVEIRTAKNRQTLNSKRHGMPTLSIQPQDSSIPVFTPDSFASPSHQSSHNSEPSIFKSSNSYLPFRDSPAGEIFIILENLCKQKGLLTQESFISHVNSLESFDIRNLTNIPGSNYFQETLHSIMFLSEYLKVNYLSNIDITQQLLQKLSMLCLAYQMNPTNENYFLTLSSLQTISRIAFFLVEYSLVQKDIITNVLYWTQQDLLELEYNSFNAMYMIQCQCSHEEEQVLARKYNFINICIARMTQATKTMQIFKTNNIPNNLNPQLLQQTLNMLLRIMQDNIISRIKQSSDSWSEQIQCMCECLSENSDCFEYTELYMMVHIVFLTLSSSDSKEILLTTIQIMNKYKTIKKLLEIITIGMFCINSKDLMKLAILIMQILLTLSNIGEFYQDDTSSYPQSDIIINQNNFAMMVPPPITKSIILLHVSASDLLDSLVQFLDRDFAEQRIKLIILKIFYNIGIDSQDILKTLIQHKQFIQALIMILDMNQNYTEINTEILLILERILCEIAVDSPQDLTDFLGEQGLKIYYQILNSSNPIREHISMVYDQLSLIFDILDRQKSKRIMQLLEIFRKQCEIYQFCSLGEKFITERLKGDYIDEEFAIEYEEIIGEFLSKIEGNEYSDEECYECLSEQDEKRDQKYQYDGGDADDEREE